MDITSIKVPKEKTKIVNSRQILGALASNPSGLSFGQLLKATTLSRRTVSKHLKELARNGFTEKVEGKFGRHIITMKGMEKLNSLQKPSVEEKIPSLAGKELLQYGAVFHQRIPQASISGSWSFSVTPGTPTPKPISETPLKEAEGSYVFTIPKSLIGQAERGWVSFGWRKSAQEKEEEKP